MWTLNIQDPSGEIRKFSIKPATNKYNWHLGRGDGIDFPVRDPLLPNKALGLELRERKQDYQKRNNHFLWMSVSPDSKPAILGDVEVREAEMPIDQPVKIGESKIWCTRTGTRSGALTYDSPWKTVDPIGEKTLWSVSRAASTTLSIYLNGETGTGKEVIAKYIHKKSDRSRGPFIPINCGALPLGLAESELFGHEKGAFTGAIKARSGAVLQAHSGTLFLDEIADLPIEIQVKLLRFLENGEIRSVGSDKVMHADVRLICATHKPLKKLVEEGKFRRDLYYRVASISIKLPPLRQRPEDIVFLAIQFANGLDKKISRRALNALQSYSWPGNVRELKHAVERAAGLCGPFRSTLLEDDFEFLFSPDSPDDAKHLALDPGLGSLNLKKVEKALLIKALRASKGNRTKAAKTLGVARSTLFEMLKRYKIQGPKSSEWDYINSNDLPQCS